MGPREYGRIGQRLRAEYTYLERFARDIVAGRVSVPWLLLVCSYTLSLYVAATEGTTIRQEKQGYSMMRRVLDAQAKHCSDCIRYASMDLDQSAACRCLPKGVLAVLIASARLSTRGVQESTLLSKFHL